MLANPVTARCTELFDCRTHAVIGISPFNSYFSEARILELAHWASRNFTAFHLYVPDKAASLTLEALGYSPERAEKKARRQANYLQNKIVRALCTLGLATEVDDILLNSDALTDHSDYLALLAQFEALFLCDNEFREGCLDSAEWVLEKHPDRKGDLTPAAIALGARYFLAEMPFFLNTPRILGVQHSVFCYHQCPRFLRELLEKERGGAVSLNQGFVEIASIIQPAPESTREPVLEGLGADS
jgi:cyclo(L-tyrosyl-L-tyrosyl) synthase